MREHLLPKHSDVAILFVTSAVLIAGPVVGVILARLFAPGSGMALLIGFVLLPCAHLAGRVAGAAMGFVVDPKSEGRRAIRAFSHLGRWIDESRTPHGPPQDGAFEGRFPRGGAMFILVHAMLALAAGLIVGLVLTDTRVLTVVCAYTFTGATYGGIVYLVALKGYLLMRSERAD